VRVFSKNKRCQNLFMENAFIERPADIVFDGTITLAEGPLEVTIPVMESILLTDSLNYAILDDPEVEISCCIEIDPFNCGGDS